MRAVQIDVHGGPEALVVREIPEPQCGEDQVLVRTVASTLNPVDWKTRAWDVGPALPATLGWDLAGVVVASPSPEFSPGDRVIAMSAQIATGRGTWAELVALPGNLLTPAPKSLTLAEAAALPLAGTTAVQALDKLRLKKRDRLLVTGAAGGVGGLAIQLARQAGAQVDGLVSRPEHAATVRDLGAGTVVDRAADLPERAYDAVLDTAGVDVSSALVAGGGYVSISDDPLPDVPGAAKSYVQESKKDLATLVELVDAGQLRVRVATHHPVTEVRTAHELFEAGGLDGKVVLLF